MDKKFVHKRFEYQADINPNLKAIDCGTATITYGRLNEQSNQLGRLLEFLKISTDDIIAVLHNEGIDQIRSLIAVFKAGAIYMPLDQTFSALRKKQVFDSCPPNCLISNITLEDQAKQLMSDYAQENAFLILVDSSSDSLSLKALQNTNSGWVECKVDEQKLTTENLDKSLNAEDGCYIYFTSGSTGVPKAIFGRHIGLAHFINWEIEEFSVNQKDKISQLTAVTFDAYLRDVFAPLCAGGTLCIPSVSQRQNMVHLLEWLEDSEITLIHCVPSLFRTFMKVLESKDTQPPVF